MEDEDDVLPYPTMGEHWEREREKWEEECKAAKAYNESVDTHEFIPPVKRMDPSPPFSPFDIPQLGGAIPSVEPPALEHICVRCQWSSRELVSKGLEPKPYGPCNPEGALKRKLLRKRRGKAEP